MAGAEVRSNLLCLVFTDLVESTALKSRLGDIAASELFANYHGELLGLAAESDGREIDSAGDGFFLTFESPSAAVTFALRLQLLHSERTDLPPVRIGAHLGEVTERPAPAGSSKAILVGGLAVDVAARISSLARGGQVLMSQPVFEAARQRLDAERIGRTVSWLAHGAYLLKGIDGPIQIGEAGFDGVSPLAPPSDSEKARSATAAGEEWTPRFRPAAGVANPDRADSPDPLRAEAVGEGRSEATTLLCFEDCELNEVRFELKRNGAPVDLEPKVLRLLLFLVRERARTCAKDEILAELWPDTIVSDDALFSVLKKARRAVGDDAASQKIIQTVRGRGYRFVASVEELELAATPSPAGSSIQLVGRDETLARLDAAIESMLAGSGRLVLLEGEAGVGKTSVTKELATRARARGIEVHTSWGWQGGGAPAFWLWVQIIRSFLRDWDRDTLSACLGAGAVDIAQVVPELRDALSELPQPQHAEPDEARFRLLDAMSRFFHQASARKPLMLVLEDLHWADPVSLVMSRFLLQNIDRRRLLLVGTYRGDEIDPYMIEDLHDMSQHSAADLISLEGLDIESLRVYAEALSGRETSRQMAATLHSATGGNPFFVKQIVGLLTYEPGDESDERQIDALPVGSHALTEWRLRRLSDPGQSLLAIASAIGHDFSLTLLTRASELPADELLPALDEALDANLIEPLSRTERTYRFSHALVCESIHQTLSTTRRAKIHRQIGEALEELHKGDPTEHLAALAYHFGEAAPLLQGSQAADYAKLAGDEARARLSYEKAAELFGSAAQAYELLGSPDPVRHAELLISHAGALFSADEAERAQATFHQAAIIARGGDAPELLAVAAIGYGGIGIGVADDEAVGLLQEALDALGDDDSLFRVWTLSTLVVHLANFPGTHERVTELVRRNVEMARSIGEPISLGFALVGKFAFERAAARTSIAERLAAVTEAADLGEKAGYPLLTVNARWQMLGGLLEIGDMAAADAEYVRLATVLEQLSSPRWNWLAPTYRATRQLLDGHYEDVEKSANEAYALRDLTRGSTDPAGHVSLLFALKREQGRLGDIVDALAGLLHQFTHIPAVRCALVVALLESDRQIEARSHFDAMAEDDFEQIVGKSTWRPALAFLTVACASFGDEARAGHLYELLKPSRGEALLAGTIQFCLGPASLYLGMLAGTMGRWQDAATLFDEALVECDALDSSPWRARTQLAFARTWLARDQAGDLDRAGQLLTAARTTAEELGMVRIRAEIGEIDARISS